MAQSICVRLTPYYPNGGGSIYSTGANKYRCKNITLLNFYSTKPIEFSEYIANLKLTGCCYIVASKVYTHSFEFAPDSFN